MREDVSRHDGGKAAGIRDSDASRSFLLHVHVCVQCGSAIRREELEGRGHTTGIFLCPKCGTEGPLNLEIRDIENSASRPTEDNDSPYPTGWSVDRRSDCKGKCAGRTIPTSAQTSETVSN